MERIFPLGKSGSGAHFQSVAIFKLRNLDSGQATPIPEGEFTIGRNDDAYVHVEDGMVSRRHAKLYNTADGIFIEDAGSGNGTVVRGVKITARTQLEIGDQIQLGPVVFRVDPERTGDTASVPTSGARTVDRTYMRRDTERLPVAGEPARVVEAIAPDKLAAPDVNPADAEAEELNAIVMREPEAHDPLRLPILRPGLTPLPGPTAPKLAMPVPAAPSLSVPKLKPEPAPARPAAIPAPAPQTMAAPVALAASGAMSAPAQEKVSLPPQTRAEPPSTPMSWGWGLLIFLAGLGTGLLVGLVFARIFIELGGKVGALP